MNKLLVIGNGFDLAHGKCTRYSDFLGFLEDLFEERLEEKVYDDLKEKRISYKESALINYLKFYNTNNKIKKNWTDMEIELSNYIRQTVATVKAINNQKQDAERNGKIYSGNPNVFAENERVILRTAKSVFETDGYSYFNIKDKFINPWGVLDIERVMRRFEKELDELKKLVAYYFREIEPGKRSNPVEKKESFEKLGADRVICFNYTDTYEALYGIDRKDIFYVHGQLKDKNIVLGYCSDWCDEACGLDLGFEKYLQRLNNGTDRIGQVLDEITDETVVYFYGHSLHVSDRDVLLQIIEKAKRVNIFYHNEDDRKDKLKALFMLLGKVVAERRILNEEIVLSCRK